MRWRRDAICRREGQAPNTALVERRLRVDFAGPLFGVGGYVMDNVGKQQEADP